MNGRITLDHIIAAEPARHPKPKLAVEGPASKTEQAANTLLGVIRVIAAGGNWTEHISAARLGIEVAQLFACVATDRSLRLETMKFLYGFASSMRTFDEKRLSNRKDGDHLIGLLDGMKAGCLRLLGPLDRCLKRNTATTN